MQVIIRTLCNAKVGTSKCGNYAPTYKEKKFSSTNSVEDGFWYDHDNVKSCVSNNKNEYVMDWPIGPNIWPLKGGINISREKVFGTSVHPIPTATKGGNFALL